MGINLDDRDILLRPILTEKSSNNMADGKYTFEVHRMANKHTIRRAIENLYEVRVDKINTLNVKSKPKRRGLQTGKTRTWKKAVIKLQEGYTIPELDDLR